MDDRDEAGSWAEYERRKKLVVVDTDAEYFAALAAIAEELGL